MFYLPHTPLILPQLIYFPFFLILLFIFNFHPRPHLPYIDPTSTLHGPHTDPTPPFFSTTTFLLFSTATTTTATTFLLFSLHHHHRYHISIVFPPPPPPLHFHWFPHHHHISIVFPPPPPQFYCSPTTTATTM